MNGLASRMLTHQNDRPQKMRRAVAPSVGTFRARRSGDGRRQWVGDCAARRKFGASAVSGVAADTRSDRSSSVDARHRRRRVVTEKSTG